MLTRTVVFLLFINIIHAYSLQQKLFDLKENEESNKTVPEQSQRYVEDDELNMYNKRDTSTKLSPETTKIAAEFIADIIGKLLSNSSTTQSYHKTAQEVQSANLKKKTDHKMQLVSQEQISHNLNFKEGSEVNLKNKQQFWDVPVQTDGAFVEQNERNKKTQQNTLPNSAENSLDRLRTLQRAQIQDSPNFLGQQKDKLSTVHSTIQNNWNIEPVVQQDQSKSGNDRVEAHQVIHELSAKNIGSEIEENPAQYKLQSFPEFFGTQNQGNHEVSSKIYFSGAQRFSQKTNNNLNTAQIYQNEGTDSFLQNSAAQNSWSGVQSAGQGQSLQKGNSQTIVQPGVNWNKDVSNWEQQNVGISNINTPTNAPNTQYSSVVQNWGDNEIRKENQVNQISQVSLAQSTETGTVENKDPQVPEGFPPETFGQANTSNLQNYDQSGQNNFNGVQDQYPVEHLTENSLNNSSAQNNWSGIQIIHQSSDQNTAQNGSNWYKPVANWQQQNLGPFSWSTQNNIHTNPQHSIVTLNSWNNFHNTLPGQNSQHNGFFQHTMKSGSQGSLATNLDQQSNTGETNEDVQSTAYRKVILKKNRVAIQRAKYHFATRINDNIKGNYQERNEHRNGSKVTGSYSYDDGNILRTVSYIADEKGYRVLSDDIQPSRKAATTLNRVAEVKMYNNGISTEYSVKADRDGGYNEAMVNRGDVQEVS